MSKRLTGLNPLAYIGVEPVQPVNTFMRNFAPGPTDSRNVNIGDFWIDTATQTLWVLVSLAGGVATWISLPGGSADSFVTDSGTAIPAAGILNLNGDGVNINTTGAGNTVHVHMNTDPTLTGLTLTGFTGGVLVSNGAGVISEVTTTNHSLLIGNSSGTISSLGVATNGQIPIGSTGADPVLSTITAGTGISVTNGAGSITIAATGGTGTVTSISAGTGITLTPNPITTTGSVALTVPVIVANGGTGDTSFTAYSVITGGTTSTGALQNVSGVGTSGQVLTSNGAAALPTWQNSASATTYDGNSGSATPSGGVINIVGSGGITTTASGSTVTIIGVGVPLEATITLTSSQIKNLFTTPVLFISAQGANTIINPISVINFFSYGGNNAFVAPTGGTIFSYFTNSNSSNLAAVPICSSNTYQLTSSVYTPGNSTSSTNSGISAANCVNQPLYIAVDSSASGNITGNAAGDNTLKIKMIYEVITVPL